MQEAEIGQLYNLKYMQSNLKSYFCDGGCQLLHALGGSIAMEGGGGLYIYA